MREQQGFTQTKTRHPRQELYSQRNNRQYPPANQHREEHYSGTHPEDAPYTTGDVDEIEEDESFYTQRPRTSVRRWQDNPVTQTQGKTRYDVHADQVIQRPQRAHRPPDTTQRHTESVPKVKAKRQRRGFRAHPLLYLGLGMIVMLLLWIGGSSLVAWIGFQHDTIVYGTPRTYQFDAVVGHNDSPTNPTHFILVNLNRHIEIIELPGGDASHARIYNGPVLFGDGQDLTPVTGKVEDVNGDGKPDLVLFIQDQRIVFINTGSEFRPLKPGEQVTIP